MRRGCGAQEQAVCGFYGPRHAGNAAGIFFCAETFFRNRTAIRRGGSTPGRHRTGEDPQKCGNADAHAEKDRLTGTAAGRPSVPGTPGAYRAHRRKKSAARSPERMRNAAEPGALPLRRRAVFCRHTSFPEVRKIYMPRFPAAAVYAERAAFRAPQHLIRGKEQDRMRLPGCMRSFSLSPARRFCLPESKTV